ncbi:hypothetical protein EU527_04580 [Candidatus Thorarchaeota archaeon]|nr:MAG: hypothetical protein EU527_04580 [Candidatus Thorarchaeota archaeon]
MGLVQGIEFLDALGLFIGVGIAQSVVLIGLYLKNNEDNNPTNFDDKNGPPDTWVLGLVSSSGNVENL